MSTEHAHGIDHLLVRIAFIEMDSAGHHRHGDARDLAQHKFALVSLGCGPWEVGDLRVGDAGGILDRVAEGRETGAEDHADPRGEGRPGPGPNGRDRFVGLTRRTGSAWGGLRFGFKAHH